MRISAAVIILLGISTFTLWAAEGNAQEMDKVKISFIAKNESLASVLRQIEKLTPFHFVYPSARINDQQVSFLSADHLTVTTVLNQLLGSKNLIYKQMGDNILIDAAPKKIASIKKTLSTIDGKVTDENGQPLPGVTVKVKNSNKAAVTDGNGVYHISANASDILLFSLIGYDTMEQPVNEKTTVTVSLKPSSNQMKEVVVIGYGTQTKKDITTSISSLGSADINNFPATGVDKAMTGKLAGVQVLQPNGAPGAGISIKVRGTGSITAGSDPLYVVDGVPLSDNDINGPGFKVNPLNAINVNDIESIDVLKDASAAAIYGSRGSNGVVLITTKRGKKDQLSINVNSYYGLQSITREIPMLDAYQTPSLFMMHTTTLILISYKLRD